MSENPVAHIFSFDDEELMKQAVANSERWQSEFMQVPDSASIAAYHLRVAASKLHLDFMHRCHEVTKLEAAALELKGLAARDRAALTRLMRAIALIEAYEAIGALP